jgi:hypothetical protein
MNVFQCLTQTHSRVITFSTAFVWRNASTWILPIAERYATLPFNWIIITLKRHHGRLFIVGSSIKISLIIDVVRTMQARILMTVHLLSQIIVPAYASWSVDQEPARRRRSSNERVRQTRDGQRKFHFGNVPRQALFWDQLCLCSQPYSFRRHKFACGRLCVACCNTWSVGKLGVEL